MAGGASVGSFGIDFMLNTARFEAGIAKAESEVSAFTRKVQVMSARARDSFQEMDRSIATTVGRMAGLAIAAAPVAIAALTARAIEQVGAQVDLAARLDTTTNKLAAMQMQAQASGVENDALATSLQRMAVNIAKAEQGAKTQTEALARLGLTTKDLAGLSTDEQYARIADAMQGMQSATQRALVAQELFGKSGVALVPILMQGSEGLRAAEQQALALGVALNQVDAEKVDAAGDAMGMVGKAVEGVGNRIAVALSPYITQASNDFVDMAVSAQGGQTQISTLVQYGAKGLGFLSNAVVGVQIAFNGVTMVIKGIASVALQSFSFIEKALNAAIRGIGSLRLAADDAFGYLDAKGRARAEELARYNTNLFGSLSDAFMRSAGEDFDTMRNLASGEIPSEAIQRWMREAEAAANAAAAGIQRVHGAMGEDQSGGAGGSPGKGKKGPKSLAELQDAAFAKLNNEMYQQTQAALSTEIDVPSVADRLKAEQEVLAQQYAQVQQYLLSKEQLEQQTFATHLEQLQAGYEGELISREEFNAQLEQLVAQHEMAVTQIVSDEAAKRLEFQAMSSGQQVKTVLGDMVQMTAGVAQHSKTLFKINKAAALAQAIVALPEHVSKTMAQYPFPISVAMGALAAAASLAQINAIRSSQFSGGGGGTTPSSAGSVPVVNGMPVAQSQVADFGTQLRQRSDRVDVVLEGGTFSAEGVRSLVEQLTEALGDNVSGKIVLRGV